MTAAANGGGPTYMGAYTKPLLKPAHPIRGRDHEMAVIRAVFERPETSNAIILAEPGTGKTALVEQLALTDTDREYREVDIPKMTGDGTKDPTPRLQGLFREAMARAGGGGRDLVLFMDEFHQIVTSGHTGAVEALKPILAQSASLGLRIIAATTLEEYHKYVAPNEALAERLQRIALAPPARDVVLGVLVGIARDAGIGPDEFAEQDAAMVYDAAQRYLPGQAQPRKSIGLLDSMIGWRRLSAKDPGMGTLPMDRALLGRVLAETANVTMDVSLDPDRVEQAINDRVVSQQFAARRIKERLAVAMAGIGDPTRPLASFLMVGPTSVGKTETAKVLARALFGDDSRHLLRYDMTEYSAPSDAQRFRSDISSGIWAMPHAVVLLDEVEKANPAVVRLLLQILDDGRLSDDYGRQVTFVDAYIIMTTNAGVRGTGVFNTIAQWNGSRRDGEDDPDDAPLADYEQPIRKAILNDRTNGSYSFSPELLARIDCVVPYQPLDSSAMLGIVRGSLARFADDMRSRRGVSIEYDDRVVRYIALEKAPPTDDPDAGSARYANSLIDDAVKSAVAMAMIKDPLVSGLRLGVEGAMRIDDPDIVKGRARISVSIVSERSPRPMERPAGRSKAKSPDGGRGAPARSAGMIAAAPVRKASSGRARARIMT